MLVLVNTVLPADFVADTEPAVVASLEEPRILPRPHSVVTMW